ncbi:hypothetical protein [Maridesulfovibrio hydrothermalis]|uniref:YkgJ family cysteine cluster protein n=2 Tax=Maridesulfovibrio TaxID=2794998 RepID=L0RHK7_9BACT|nr:hypothetical protein [Maridesulfovibrio hydrothermalis]CCO25061.1 conserved protein of unknown function [Maridesulfovibrio hydrothermalis AM13 = DSM 14728]
MCGRCCKGICLYIDSKWIKKEKQFIKLTAKYEYLKRFEVCGKTDCNYLKFSCKCLSEAGTCMDYDNRPELCKRFPAPSIFAQNGELPQGCGFRMSTEADFEKILKEAINNEDHYKVDSGPD